MRSRRLLVQAPEWMEFGKWFANRGRCQDTCRAPPLWPWHDPKPPNAHMGPSDELGKWPQKGYNDKWRNIWVNFVTKSSSGPFPSLLAPLTSLIPIINLRIFHSVLCQQGPNAAEWRDRGEPCIRTTVSLIQWLSGLPSSPGEVYADVVEHHGADVI